MGQGAASAVVPIEILRKANALDTLAAVLPANSRDRLADILTDDDIATLKHLVGEGLGQNTLRAMTSDLVYLDAWCRAATGATLPWPAPIELLLKFVAHHLWDESRRRTNEQHGMPPNVCAELSAARLLRGARPLSPATVRRRMALWSTMHRWRGLIGPFADPHIKVALRAATRVSGHGRVPKSARAITADILDRMVETCAANRLVDVRDRAMLLFAFASGGRRRSEVAGLTFDQVVQEPGVADPDNPAQPFRQCLSIRLGRTKTEDCDARNSVFMVGRPAEALLNWLSIAQIEAGPVFRSIDRWGRIAATALTPEAVNLIVKRRCRMAGLDPKLFSAHGLRSGYLTEAARRRIPLAEAMQQSRHASVQQANRYYNEAERSQSQAARIIV